MAWINKNKVACFLLFCGILFLIIGVNRGEDQAVLQKAIRICLECIGIG